MPASLTEPFRTLYGDPGEDTGWALGKGSKLLAGGTEKMWTFFDEVHYVLDCEARGAKCDGMLAQGGISDLRDGVEAGDNTGPLKRIVLEDWRLYPWELQNMKWDPCRTARLIGGLTGLCRIYMVDLVFQPAAIKQDAQRAGAEQFYYRPLKENRHANDAIQHFTYFVQTEMLGTRKVVTEAGAAAWVGAPAL